MFSHRYPQSHSSLLIFASFYYLSCALIFGSAGVSGANSFVQPVSNFQAGHQTQAPPSLATAATFNIPTIPQPHRSSQPQANHVQVTPQSTTSTSSQSSFHHSHVPLIGRQSQAQTNNAAATQLQTTTTTLPTSSTTTPAPQIHTITNKVTSTTLSPSLMISSNDSHHKPSTSLQSQVNLGTTTSAKAIILTTPIPNSMGSLDEFASYNPETATTNTPGVSLIYNPHQNLSFDSSINFSMPNEHQINGAVIERHDAEHKVNDHQDSSVAANSQTHSNSFSQIDPPKSQRTELNADPDISSLNLNPTLDSQNPPYNISNNDEKSHSLASDIAPINQFSPVTTIQTPESSPGNITESNNTSHSHDNLTTPNENKATSGSDGRGVIPTSNNSSLKSTSVVPPLNNTLLPRVQILKPKLKFRCNVSSDCKNDALCHNGTCFCPPGFTGESCDINIDECRQYLGGQPCLNNGTCVDEINAFRCDCPPGFRGDRCQDLADMCYESPCLNNATCINHRTSYTCRCEPGWEGKHCEIDIDDCAKGPCLNGATCHDMINQYRCECPSGFTGVNCETNINDCAINPCQNNSTCRDMVNDYECECLPGFSGKNCEENIDDCFNSPCFHGKCTDLINGFKCSCHDGWTGEVCDTDINECDTGRPVCHNGGSCENLEPSYQCHCREGWTGK